MSTQIHGMMIVVKQQKEKIWKFYLFQSLRFLFLSFSLNETQNKEILIIATKEI